MVTVYYQGTVLLTAPPTEEDQKFVATIQYLAQQLKEANS